MGRGSCSATHFCVVSDGSSPVRQWDDALAAEALFMTSHPRPAGSDASDPPPARSVSGSQQANPQQSVPSGQSTTPLPLPGTAATITGTTTGFHATAIPQRHPVEANPRGKRLALLSLTALGIVYGD